MNISEFEELELQVQQSGLPLKLYLQQVGVSYSTYHYWRKKCAAEKDSLKLKQELAPWLTAWYISAGILNRRLMKTGKWLSMGLRRYRRFIR